METNELNKAMAPEQEEIVPGMTVEEIKAIFFDARALREPPYRVYQLNTDGHRYYYRYDEKGEPHFYPSVTTLLKQVMPTSPALIEWMVKNGAEGSVEKRDLAAAYGTFMHAQFESLIINRRYDFDAVPGVLAAFMERENLPEKFYGDSLAKIRKDVLAFAQFVKDWNVRPLAVEIGLVHPEKNYAGCIDLPCMMTDTKTGETFPAIVDFKSGRKGFWEEHELQLHLYRDMWNVNFPDIPIQRVFNFSPKDWCKGPTYNLKEQTNSVNAAKLPYLLSLAAIEDEKRDNTVTIVRGIVDLDNGAITDNVISLSLAELIKNKDEKRDHMAESTDIPEFGDFKPVEEAEAPKPINSTSEAEKPVKTEIGEKQLIRAGGSPTPFDVCQYYCKEKNCDYCLGEHGHACIEAKSRAGYIDPEQVENDSLLNPEFDF